MVATLKSGAPDDESTELDLKLAGALNASAGRRGERTGHIKVITAVKSKVIYYYAPTLLAGALQDDAIVQKRHWSSSVTPFDNEEQVVNWANDSQYGLASGMDERCGASRSAHGCNMAVPNNTISCWYECRTVGETGYGKDMSLYGLEDYTVVRHVG